jgi:Tfp pilus assembly protein PilZ
MPDAIQHHAPMGLSQIAEEFKLLDDRRRSQGLSLSDAERYQALFARLDDALASNERHRRVDERQFLRVRFAMELHVRSSVGDLLVTCQDFGGGGCSIACPEVFALGEELLLNGALIEGKRHPLRGRAVVAWARLPSLETAQGYGLRFAIDSREMRDQIDRLLYRVLDRFLAEPTHSDRLHQRSH